MFLLKHFFFYLGLYIFYPKFIIFSTIRKRPLIPNFNFPPDYEEIPTLLKTFSGENSLLKLIISEPNEFKGRNLSKYIESLPWEDMLFTKSFEKSLANGLQIVLCRIRSNILAIVSRKCRIATFIIFFFTLFHFIIYFSMNKFLISYIFRLIILYFRIK